MKKNQTVVVIFIIFVSSLLSLAPSRAEDATLCPIGQQRSPWTYDSDGNGTPPIKPCEPATWKYEKSSDGFSSSFYIYATPHPGPNSSAGPEDWVVISCEKKSLSIFVLYAYPYSVGWSGQGQVLFDSGKPSAIKYRVNRDFKSFTVTSPKEFLAKLVKAKTSFSLKIPLVSGTKLGTYAKGDLLSYRTTFAKAGCKF
jgi:hypothetical protein